MKKPIAAISVWACALLSLMSPKIVLAQVGGIGSFDFINLPHNARLSGIGGVNVSTYDDDVNLWVNNPAGINAEMAQRASINVMPYYGNVVQTSINYAWNGNKTGPWATSFTYMNYGSIDETDATGNVLGTFAVNEYALALGKGHKVDNYSLGASAKILGSSLSVYNSVALAVDLGGMFIHPDRDLKLGLSIRNVGMVLSRYTPDAETNLPFQVTAGASAKPENMPVRFHFGGQYLQRRDIVFDDPNKPRTLDANGNEIKEEVTLAERIGRHLVFGAELLLSQNFHIRAGYNYLRRRELRLEDRSGGAGFSIGAFVRIKRFDLGFTRVFYHVAGGTTAITLSTQFGQMKRKKEINEPIPGLDG